MRAVRRLVFIIAVGCVRIADDASLARKRPEPRAKRDAFDGSDCLMNGTARTSAMAGDAAHRKNCLITVELRSPIDLMSVGCHPSGFCQMKSREVHQCQHSDGR